LSVPLTMTVKIALESSEDTRWLAILLGTEEVSEPKPAPAKKSRRKRRK
jgi:AI-2 transport protein TqsA